MATRRIVVMGVTGSGKTTAGRLLSERLGAPFVDADDLHPGANVTKMAAGRPLDDTDRAPWLLAVREELAAAETIVVACSALKRRYRDLLRQAGDVTFVFLDVAPDVAGSRVADRLGHFMKADMVAGQFADLELPAGDERDVHVVDAECDVDEIVRDVVSALDTGRPGGG